MNQHAAEKLDVALGFWVAQQFSGFALAFGWRSGSPLR
jgi:hypothetical protein